MTEMDDHELLQQYARRGSEAAFALLVKRYVNLVYSAALRFTANAHDAEEVTQVVFVILARKAAGLSPRVVLSGWLYHTTRFTAANFVKVDVHRQQREQEVYMESISSPADDGSWKQIAPLLDDAMGHLGESDRNAVVLRFFENKSAREVAAALMLNESTAQRRLNRAVEKLRRFFNKRGVLFPVAVLTAAISAHSVQAAPAALANSVTAVAIAKGAAATGSTVTLINGTLKLMAWTKMKIAVITASMLLLATVSTVSVRFYVRPAPPRQTGRWKLPAGNVTPMVAYTYSHGLILASDGSLWSWGVNRDYVPVLGLKNTNINNSVSLRRVGTEADWVNISVGESHCLAIKSDGTLWAWGNNLYYQLGDGTKKTLSIPSPSVPGNDWKEAVAGFAQSLALKKDGTIWAWGDNWAGGLGIGNIRTCTNAMQVGTSTNWARIWSGGLQTVGLQRDGTLWFWGTFAAGDSIKSLVPMRIVGDTNWTDVCFGYFTILAVRADGTLWSWGREANFYTQTPDASSNAVPMQVGTDNDWVACASPFYGFYHILKKKDGSFWALDASGDRFAKKDREYKPLKLSRINLHKDVVAFTAGGSDIGVMLTRDGEVWTWGTVIGELSPDKYTSPRGQPLNPKLRVVSYPWQIANIDSTE
jgi:RNA polymerase sigma factor (sigma-70 family)